MQSHFQNFPTGMPPNPLVIACFACWLCFVQQSYTYVCTCAYNFKFENHFKIWPDHFKFASFSPDTILFASQLQKLISELTILSLDCLAVVEVTLFLIEDYKKTVLYKVYIVFIIRPILPCSLL